MNAYHYLGIRLELLEEGFQEFVTFLDSRDNVPFVQVHKRKPKPLLFLDLQKLLCKLPKFKVLLKTVLDNADVREVTLIKTEELLVVVDLVTFLDLLDELLQDLGGKLLVVFDLLNVVVVLEFIALDLALLKVRLNLRRLIRYLPVKFRLVLGEILQAVLASPLDIAYPKL